MSNLRKKSLAERIAMGFQALSMGLALWFFVVVAGALVVMPSVMGLAYERELPGLVVQLPWAVAVLKIFAKLDAHSLTRSGETSDRRV